MPPSSIRPRARWFSTDAAAARPAEDPPPAGLGAGAGGDPAVTAAATALAAGISAPCRAAFRTLREQLDRLADRRPLPAETAELLAAARDVIAHTDHFLNRVEQYADPAPAQFEVVEVRAMIEAALTALRPNLPLAVRLGSRHEYLDDRVLADHGQIMAILVGLGINSGEAMPVGGTIVFRSGRSSGMAHPDGRVPAPREGFVWIEVQDTGTGISPELLPHIFEPFVTTKPDPAAGLGLAGVYHVLREHGGGVTVESVVGAGTRTRLYLPRTLARIFREPDGGATGHEPLRR